MSCLPLAVVNAPILGELQRQLALVTEGEVKSHEAVTRKRGNTCLATKLREANLYAKVANDQLDFRARLTRVQHERTS
jgi:hypothetical protein